MKHRKLKLGVAGLLATAVIATTSITSPTSASAQDVKGFAGKEYTSTWQTYVIEQMANKFGIKVDKEQKTITFGSIKIKISEPTKQTVTPMPTKPVAPVEEKQSDDAATPATPTATPTQVVTPKPSTTPEVSKAPTETVKPTTPAETVKPVPTQPVATPTPAETVKPVPTQPVATPTPAETVTPTPAPTEQTTKFSAVQQEILTLVNKERAAAGLKALQLNVELSEVATEKARDMDVNNYFSHTSPTYGSPFDMMQKFGITYRYAGENIASGQKNAEQVMNDWMNSQGHRANILNANFTTLGVGYVNGEWVQMFIG